MQGWKNFIPTETKIAYLNHLLQVGFDVLDFGSFVSAKAIPQLADTKDVIPRLNVANTKTQLLAIIANLRGAKDAVHYEQIRYLGFPFSISETFQLRNTNKTIAESLKEVEAIQNLCVKHNKKAVIYISMGFGNPYGDEYSAELTIQWFERLQQLGIDIISLADTVGLADRNTIEYIFHKLIPEFPKVNIGAHFHSTPGTWEEKLVAAWHNGCTRFDSSIQGIGGCPMAEDELVGNLATENIVQWADQQNLPLQLDRKELARAMVMASEIFV